MIAKAPIDLKSYFFPYVQVAADPEFNFDRPEIHPDIQVKRTVEPDENNGLYQVTLNITVMPGDEHEKIPYSIEWVAVGLFSVAEGTEEPVRMLEINGASILYSAAREFVITITSRGPWPQFALPTASFYYPKDQRAATTQDEKAEPHKKD